MSDTKTPSSTESSHPHILYVTPFLAFAALAYAAVAVVVGTDRISSVLEQPVVSLALTSHAPIRILVKDAFILGVFGLLFCEIWKSALNENRAILNHILSVLVAGACLYAFLVYAAFDTMTFLYITLAAAFDVIAGIYITWRSKPLHEPDPVFVFRRGKR